MPRATLHKQNLKLHKNRFLFSGSAVIFTTLLGLFTVNFFQIFASDNSYAETHTDSASGAYNSTTYSMTTAVSDLNLELYNVTPAGKATYGKQTVNVTTNAPGGYQLYVQTSGNLAGTKAGTATSDSIVALPSNNSTLDMNTWGYTQTTPNEDANTAADQTIWNTPPSTLTQIDSTSSTATSGRDTDVYYGIKADNTLSGDNYSGTITYTTIASDVTSADESTNGLTVSPTSGTASTASTLTITTPLMASSSLTASEITATVGSYSCTSVTITSQAPLTFTCSVTASNAGTYNVSATISKYDKTYTKTSAYTAKTPDLSGVTYMQDVTQAMCANATTWTPSNKKQYTLKDKRDNNSYTVRKLADGNCWMVDSLRLIDKTIDSSNSNITSDNSFTIPASTSSGDDDGWCQTSGADCEDKPLAYKYIYAYYNWYTATAGTGATSASSATSSICPKSGSGSAFNVSWHLPTGGPSGEWYNLLVTKGGLTDKDTNSPVASTVGSNSPYKFAFSGFMRGGSVLGNNSSSGYGYYWASTAFTGNSTVRAAFVRASDGYIDVSTTNYFRYYGLTIRCVLSSS